MGHPSLVGPLYPLAPPTSVGVVHGVRYGDAEGNVFAPAQGRRCVSDALALRQRRVRPGGYARSERIPPGKGSEGSGLRHRGALHQREGPVLRRGLPGRLHPPEGGGRPGRGAALHPPRGVYRLWACETVCPVQAIFAEADVPEQWRTFIEMNGDYYRLSREEFTAKYGRAP